MSRNIGHQSNTTPTKKLATKRTTSANSSSDDDYAGVDLISDSEDAEPDVEVAEEQVIIESEEDDDDASTPRPSIEDDQGSWNGFEMDSREVLGDNLAFFDDQMAHMQPADAETGADIWGPANPNDDDPYRRRVHFADSDSDSTASNEDDGWLNDIFISQNDLDPAFRRQIEKDDDGKLSSDDGYWDYGGEDEGVPQAAVETSDSDSPSSTGSSGYESDDGETTDEDLPEVVRSTPRVVPTKSLIREPSTSSESEEEVVTRRAPLRRSGPRLGIWTQKADRPFAVMDSRGKKILMYKAKRRSSLSDLPRLMGYNTRHDLETIEEMSPMISNSGNLMMGAMTPENQLRLIGGEILGPPEAFFPFTSISANGEITRDSPSSYDDDDYDEGTMFNVDDFLDFEGADDSDEDEDDSSSNDDPTSTPHPTTVTSEDQPQLFAPDSSLVGAWRFDKERHHLMHRNNATEDSLRFSSAHLDTTIRGIKEGRIANARAPMTPMRKQKTPKPMDSSPLAAQGNKRKFSGEVSGHKRTKSLN